jgi:hypothetical protein
MYEMMVVISSDEFEDVRIEESVYGSLAEDLQDEINTNVIELIIKNYCKTGDYFVEFSIRDSDGNYVESNDFNCYVDVERRTISY